MPVVGVVPAAFIDIAAGPVEIGGGVENQHRHAVMVDLEQGGGGAEQVAEDMYDDG